MKRIFACLLPLCIGAFAWADQPAHPDLSGKWQIDSAQSRIHSDVPPGMVWTIQQKDDGSIHFSETSEAKQGHAEFDCTTHGRDCEVQEEGKPMKVSFWYNGPALVETETRGHNAESVTKKRMKISPDGGTLTVEIEHLVPNGAPETLVLHKQK